MLEIAHYIAGPHCAMIFADHGADVVKVEPIDGERGRHAPPFGPDGDSLYFASHNRGKRSIAIDLRRREAQPALDALLAWADIVVTNHVGGVPERLGFGFERLSQLNSRAILLHITGYGSWSPLAEYAAFDGVIQAMSGFAWMTGEADGPPLLSQVLVADHSTATQAVTAGLCALWEREKTGRGRLVEVSMLDAVTSMLAHFVPAATVRGESPMRAGSRSETRFVNVLPTADSPVFLSPITPAMWREFCGLLGRPEWVPSEPGQLPEYVSNPELRRTIEIAALEWLRVRSAKKAVAEMQAVGIACGEVRSIAKICDDERTQPSGVLTDVVLPAAGARAKVPGPGFRYPGESKAPRAIPPLGADTRDVLRELGLSSEAVEGLFKAGVLRTGVTP